MGKLAIIDGDVLCHLACAPRWQDKAKKFDTAGGGEYVATQLDADGSKQVIEFSADEDNLYLDKSWKSFQSRLQQLLETLYCTDYVMAVQGDGNFRKTLYPDYKGNRHKDPKKQNKFVPIIRHFAVQEGLAIWSHGREADDFVRIWAEEARASGDDFIVCSIDKDLMRIEGMHYRMREKQIVMVDAKFGQRFYYQQLLCGDGGDNIPGLPGIGPKTAPKLLEEVGTEEEFQEIVIEQYMTAYGDDWWSYLLSNGKMIHIQSAVDDYFTLEEWPLAQALGNPNPEIPPSEKEDKVKELPIIGVTEEAIEVMAEKLKPEIISARDIVI